MAPCQVIRPRQWLRRRNSYSEAYKRAASAWVGTTPICSPNKMRRIGKRSTSHDPERLVFQVLKVINRIIGVGLIWASSPFPHISCHIREPKRTLRTLVATNSCGASCLVGCSIRSGLTTPWIDPSVATSCGFFPLGFCWQCYLPAALKESAQNLWCVGRSS